VSFWLISKFPIAQIDVKCRTAGPKLSVPAPLQTSARPGGRTHFKAEYIVLDAYSIAFYMQILSHASVVFSISASLLYEIQVSRTHHNP
jgi:hypothetical protein